MFAYRTPGVYYEQVDHHPPPIGPLRTDIAGFVGIATRGPLFQPVKVGSWTQFTSVFGAHTAQGYLAYAVEGFFANGGQTCWVVRVADPASARPAGLLMKDGDHSLQLLASSPGVWGQQVVVRAVTTNQDQGTHTQRFTLTLRLAEGQQELWRDLTLRRWVDNVTQEPDPRYIKTVLNDPTMGSRLATVLDEAPAIGWPKNLPVLDIASARVVAGRLQVEGSADGLESLTPEHIIHGLNTLELVDQVSIVAIPDIMPKPIVEVAYKTPDLQCDVLDNEPPLPPPPEPKTEFPPLWDDDGIILYLQRSLIEHCHKLKDRVAILDTRRKHTTPEHARDWRNEFDSKYAALYFPWLQTPDPLRLEGLLRAVPPSGHIAGVYARGDLATGVHKPPANAALEAVKDVLAPVSDVHHDDLNTRHVNVIRSYDGRGVRVMGARTLSSDSEWRYVNVRRLLIMIEEAIDVRSQWMVFEPNNPAMWADVERVVGSFLNDLWQRGMLDGATPDEAYYAICDETTNPPEERDRGRLICKIGVRPPWPAEFVIVRVGMTEGGTEILEETGTPNG
jgi:phage tail sheath protein FI